MSLFNELKYRNIIVISFYYLFFSIKSVLSVEFIDLKKLSINDNYFIILNDGFYLYNFIYLNCSLIYKFSVTITDNDKIFLTELVDETNPYILCLVNQYIYKFNERTNAITSYDLYNTSIPKNIYYNLFPYKIQNNDNISFILSYNDTSNLTFYYFNFTLNGKIQEPKKISFTDMKIENQMIRCLINSPLSYIQCFYYLIKENQKYFLSTKFSIDNMNIIMKDSFNLTVNNIIYEIKPAMSYNNNIFVCFSLNNTPACYINTYQTNNFIQIGCKLTTEYSPKYHVFYFNETDDFMLISRSDLTTTLVSNFNNSVKICRKYNYLSPQTKHYSVIYNNEYKYVNASNFTDHMSCNNITILPESNTILSSIPSGLTFLTDMKQTYPNYITQIPLIIDSSQNNFFYSSEYYPSSYNIIPKTDIIISNTTYIKEVTTRTKEEIITDIKNVMSDKKIGVNYEIKGEDFTIIIKPTNSTPLPNTTHIEFDDCEKIIRKEYNISDSSIITFLQIEIENNDINSLYNQIKYFSYDDKMQELDLSLCETIDTKIHYALKNNSKLDISSISDFQDLGIDILNIKDKFFNDLCYSYSESKNDMILEDRIKYIYQNYSLCEIGCTYNNIDTEYMNIVCNCKIQANDNTSNVNVTSLFFEQPKDIGFLDSNIGVIKCYNLVFSFKNKSNNIGFILFSVIVIVYIIFIICFCRNGIKPIKEYLNKEMTEKGYLTKKENKEGCNGDANPNKRKKAIKVIKKKNINLNNNNLIQKNNNKREKKENSKSNSILELVNKKKEKDKKSNKGSDIESNNMNNFGIVKINLNKYKKYIPLDSNQSLHNYTFDEAIKYDKRHIFRIAYIYLLSKQIIFRTFLQRSPLELYPLRFTLFIFMFSCDLALNALFYFNDNISKKYHYAKNLFLFTFSNNITIIIYSTLCSYFLITLLSKLSNSSNAIRNVFASVEQKIKFKKKFKVNDRIKKDTYNKIENILQKFKYKIAVLLIIETILILFFGYFVTAFCHVYPSTQMSWLLDSFLSILSRLTLELIFSFFFGKLYQISVASNFQTLYKGVMCIYDFS